jgi:hypothetical protein
MCVAVRGTAFMNKLNLMKISRSGLDLMNYVAIRTFSLTPNAANSIQAIGCHPNPLHQKVSHQRQALSARHSLDACKMHTWTLQFIVLKSLLHCYFIIFISINLLIVAKLHKFSARRLKDATWILSLISWYVNVIYFCFHWTKVVVKERLCTLTQRGHSDHRGSSR